MAQITVNLGEVTTGHQVIELGLIGTPDREHSTYTYDIKQYTNKYKDLTVGNFMLQPSSISAQAYGVNFVIASGETPVFNYDNTNGILTVTPYIYVEIAGYVGGWGNLNNTKVFLII